MKNIPEVSKEFSGLLIEQKNWSSKKQLEDLYCKIMIVGNEVLRDLEKTKKNKKQKTIQK